jgi:hypothetical protein
MTTEQVKRLLKKVREYKVKLISLQRQLNELTEEASGVGAIDYSSNKVKSSIGNSVEKRYIKFADRINALQGEYEKMFDELCDIEDELGRRMKEKLNPTEYQVIYERYINGVKPFSIRKAAAKFGYTEDAIKAIQRRSFRKMSDDEVDEGIGFGIFEKI